MSLRNEEEQERGTKTYQELFAKFLNIMKQNFDETFVSPIASNFYNKDYHIPSKTIISSEKYRNKTKFGTKTFQKDDISNSIPIHTFL